ncbi:hypothetical protein CPB86DRAFT_827907 [Serendipita vermifera]|nr:hypothetical protein CPB86DRAFT_827907 [Serendipita vermifera]
MARIGGKFIKLFGKLFKKKNTSDKSSSSTGANPVKLGSTSATSNNEDHISLHAILIGIDEYRDEGYRLAGAVNDAEAMKEYLRKEFPTSRICCLYNEMATRRGIIRELERLIHDETVKPQDPIIIFYAGHGGEKGPPRRWNIEDPLVQMIIPQDYDGAHNVITDRGLAALLDKLASVKGDNITMILDCCFSGSMTRRLQPSRKSKHRRIRSIPVTKPLPDDIDEDIFNAHAIKGARPSQRLGSASHVLLAACGASERAYEVEGRGEFTRVLLETVSRLGRRDLTYSEIIRELPLLDEQSPRCEGENRDRFLFDPKPPIRDRSFVEVQTEGNKLVVNMGVTHGVTESTEFVLFQKPDKSSPCLGILVVHSVESRRSTLNEPISPITLPAYAVQRKIVDVCFTNNAGLAAIRKVLEEEIGTTTSQLQRYSFVPREQASIKVDMEGDDVIFSYDLDEASSVRLPFRVNSREIKIIRKAIHAANHFDKALNLRPPRHKIEPFVKMDFVKLKGDDLGPHIPDGESLCKDGRVEVIAGETLYGIKITNNSLVHLYPHVFVFELGDLGIRYLYRPSTVGAKDADPPLRAGGFITLGYGTGGVTPWSHVVPDQAILQEEKVTRDAQDVDVSVFKVFLTTKPADLSPFVQESPFGGGYRPSGFYY